MQIVFPHMKGSVTKGLFMMIKIYEIASFQC